MHITCTICSDLFVPSSDVYVTICGHLFHYPCLIQWIERSKTCPQCRHKTTEKTIYRVYFTVASLEAEEDTSILRNKIDNLKFQIHLKDTDIKNVNEENAKMKFQNQGLKDEIKTLEGKIRTLECTAAAFKDQMKYLKAQNESLEMGMREARKAQEHAEKLKNIETIMRGTAQEVEDILNQHGDSYEARKSLATYVSILKREMQVLSEKKQELRDRVRQYHQELSSLNREKSKLLAENRQKSKLNKQLEEDLQHTENEKKNLQKKILDLEKAISSPSGTNPRDGALRRLLLESPASIPAKIPRLTDPTQTSASSSPLIGNLVSPESKSSKRAEPVTPFLNMKTRTISLAPLKASQSSNVQGLSGSTQYSIFKKRHMEVSSTAASQREEAYDGFGGHSKLDVFPEPSSRLQNVTKKNRPTLKQSAAGSSRLHTFFDTT